MLYFWATHFILTKIKHSQNHFPCRSSTHLDRKQFKDSWLIMIVCHKLFLAGRGLAKICQKAFKVTSIKSFQRIFPGGQKGHKDRRTPLPAFVMFQFGDFCGRLVLWPPTQRVSTCGFEMRWAVASKDSTIRVPRTNQSPGATHWNVWTAETVALILSPAPFVLRCGCGYGSVNAQNCSLFAVRERFLSTQRKMFKSFKVLY